MSSHFSDSNEEYNSIMNSNCRFDDEAELMRKIDEDISNNFTTNEERRRLLILKQKLDYE